jgi:uncharacterized membrane protein
MDSNRLGNYCALLTIRQAGRRQATVIAGGIFIISFIAMITLGILDRLTGRSFYLVAAMVVVFGINYLMTWMRFEIIRGSIELIDNLLPISGGGALG